MKQEKKQKSKLNDDRRILKSYFGGLKKTKQRIFQEIILPLVISIIISVTYTLLTKEPLLNRISLINSSIMTVVAIQIGFLITSLALIASFGSSAISKAFTKSEDEKVKYDYMKSIINTFVYNVNVYIFLLILCFIHVILIEGIGNTLNEFVSFEKLKSIIKYLYLNSFVFLIFHGNFVFLRSIRLIRLYLLAVFKNNN